MTSGKGSKGTRRRRDRGSRNGFTLIETALATVIVGVGVLAMVSAQRTFHRQNYWSTHASTAERLANEIREMTLNLPRHDPVTGQAYWGSEPTESTLDDYDDLDDFDGTGEGLIFAASLGNGPVNAQRELIADMDGWAQLVQVRSADPYDIMEQSVVDGSTDMIVVEVIVTFAATGSDLPPAELAHVTWVAPN